MDGNFDQKAFAEQIAEAIHKKQLNTKNGGPYFAPGTPWYGKLFGLVAEKSIATLLACAATACLGFILYSMGTAFYHDWMIPFKSKHLELVDTTKKNLEIQTETLHELKEVNTSILDQSKSNQDTMRELLKTQPSQVLEQVNKGHVELIDKLEEIRQELKEDKP